MRAIALAVPALLFSGVACAAWTTQTNPTSETLRSIYFHDELTGWVAGYGGVIFKTVNGGTTWAPQTSGTGNRLLSVRFVDANTGWAGAGLYVGRTANGGANWTPLMIDPSALIFRNSVFPVSADVAWAPAGCGACMPATRWFYRYTFVSGNIVTEQSFDVISSTSPFLRMYFVDADNGWAVGFSGLIRRITAASGATPSFGFQTSGTGQTLNGIFMLDANTGWIVGNGGTILATTNGGTNWNPQNVGGPTANLRDVGFTDAQNGWAVGDAGTILVTSNGGATWTPEVSPVTNTTLWSVAAKPGAVHASAGDLANSANSAILVRTDLFFADGFE